MNSHNLHKSYDLEPRDVAAGASGPLDMLHCLVAETVDWRAIRDRVAPLAPEFDFTNPNDVPRLLTQHEPELLEWLVGRRTANKSKLEAALEFAQLRSHSQLQQRLSSYIRDFDTWENEQELAQAVLAGDTAALLHAFDMHRQLAHVPKLGQRLVLSAQGESLHAVLSLHDETSWPALRGETKSKIRAYTASAAIKVASDIFHILPVPSVVVTCLAGKKCEKAKGDQKWALLSVEFDRRSLMSLDMKTVYPVAELAQFNRVENFDVVNGFSRIQPLLKLQDGPSTVH